MTPNVLDSHLPRVRPRKRLVAVKTGRPRRGASQLLEAAQLVLSNVFFGDGAVFVIASGLVSRRGVHAAEVLGEEVFAVEVVVVKGLVVVRVSSRRTKIAAPEAELDVLGSD